MMKVKVKVTGGAIIRDEENRILMQRRSDYGDWGLPGGWMEPGEAIEETMIREVLEETGLEVEEYELYAIYTGARMQYKYPDGNEVVFVMFLFNARTNLEGKLSEDGKTLLFRDDSNESMQLEFVKLEDIDINLISKVQKPVFEDLKANKVNVLRN